MSKFITTNYDVDTNPCLLKNTNKIFLCSLSQCSVQEKINAIIKNMTLSEIYLIDINDKLITITITNIFATINDLLLFYRTYYLTNNTTIPFIDSLVLQTQILVLALSELKSTIICHPINSPTWVYVSQKKISGITSRIVSIIAKSLILELQIRTGTNQIILLPFAKCHIEKNNLQNNIVLLETFVISITNTQNIDSISIILNNSLIVLISNLNLLVTLINCQCNIMINNLIKVINNQLQLFLNLFPPLPDTPNFSFSEIILTTSDFLVESVQSLQILCTQFGNVKLGC